MAKLQRPAPLTPEQFAYSLTCDLDVTLAVLSPEQRIDILKRLQTNIAIYLERQRPRPDQGCTRRSTAEFGMIADHLLAPTLNQTAPPAANDS